MQQVLWDANSGDTWLKTPDAIVRLAVHDVSYGGNVLLMHSRPLTADALDTLLTQLEQRGFQFVRPKPSS
jgi:peptidoglycan/xylan/chitin deacetylase (PgdA/CDA1 family)